MSAERNDAYIAGLVRELCKLPHETEWVEFKVNNSNPQRIGEYVSALANSAAVNGKANGYLVWGVKDETHQIVGTTFSPSGAKKGNEPLQTWLLRLLDPKLHFHFHEVEVDGKSVVLLEIDPAYRHPVRFHGNEFIRVGQVKKPLKAAPDRERALWRALDETRFEDGVAAERASAADVLRLLDYPAYFDLLQRPLPADRDGILETLAADRIIRRSQAGGWDVTNLGAMAFAKNLGEFRRLARKAVRVIQYRGAGRTETLKEQEGVKGYASGFEGLIGYINGRLPANEVIHQALRKSVPMFPELAVRELVANALIHQDFLATGTGPMVEIFEDRIEITNPGEPLVDVQRFVDTPPTSRNEALASMMRRIGICEERGSGIDKVVLEVELYQLPAPLFEVPTGFTRAVLFAHRPLSAMDRTERVRACYLHACLCYVNRKPMTNSSVRERFGIEEKNAAIASRLLKEAVRSGMIMIRNPEEGTRSRSYVPFWAGPGGGRESNA